MIRRIIGKRSEVRERREKRNKVCEKKKERT